MTRLLLWVEGQVEQTFANTLLAPHLAQFGVYLPPAILIAHARRNGKVHRGGGRRYQPMRDDIQRIIKGNSTAKSGRVFFSTMIDLYALATDFPGREHAEKQRHIPYERVQTLEQAWALDVGDPRFLPFITLHEYETYLFCQPEQLELFFSKSAQPIQNLRRIADEHENPEWIDDGPETAPSKRIIRELPAYRGLKPTIGPQVAELIGLARIRELCPHFAQWLTQLEQLGQATNEKLPA